jgi:hypothetical protein
MFLFNKSVFWAFPLLLILSSCGGSGSSDSGDVITNRFSAKQFGVEGSVTDGVSITTDANNNVYVVGRTSGGLDGNTLTGFIDFFVTKYDSAGVKKYTKQLGVEGYYTDAISVTTDANDNVYVVGNTTGGLDGNILTGTQDTFVTKYDSTGVKGYTKQIGVAGYLTGEPYVITDANGNVYVVGTTRGGLDGNTLTGISDFFVIKYDSTGVKQYTKQLGVAGYFTDATSVTTDANDNIYVVGFTEGGLDGNTLTGVSDLFVTKYDSIGTKQYTKQLGMSGSQVRGWAVVTDTIGNVYVAGSSTVVLTETRDAFITKFDSTGVEQYTNRLGVVGSNTGFYAITSDASDNIYVAGGTEGGLDGNMLTGTEDTFVTKYDSSGVKQYTEQLGAAEGQTYAYSAATDTKGNVYVTGSTEGGLDGNLLTGTRDAFVIKYFSSCVK